MHRHSYQGRKFSRERDQRRALLKGLATSLIIHGKMKTTLPKAKEIVPYVEVLITKAKIGSLHHRRQIIAKLNSIEAAHKLVDEIAPLLKHRPSGHLRITRTKLRIGDGAQLAEVSFVDELTPTNPASTPAKEASAPAAEKETEDSTP